MVSFVVPIYNVIDKLPLCFESIVAQTERELEIILVDDGSTDGSGALCDRYAASDARARVIHRPNGGLSQARNTGLDAATGEYLWFLDADDYLEHCAVEKMLAAARAGEADMAVCSISSDYLDSGFCRADSLAGEGVYRGQAGLGQALRLMDNKPLLFNSVNNKLFRRRALIEYGCRYKTIRAPAEDLEFNLNFFERCGCVALVQDALYHYMQYGGQSMVRLYDPEMFPVMQRLNQRRRALYARLLPGDGQAQTLCQRACFLQDFHCLTNAYHAGKNCPRAERLALWKAMRASPQVRQEAKAGSGLTACVLRAGLHMPTDALADGLMGALMGLRMRLGAVYVWFRDRVMMRGGGGK